MLIFRGGILTISRVIRRLSSKSPEEFVVERVCKIMPFWQDYAYAEIRFAQADGGVYGQSVVLAVYAYAVSI